MTNKCIFRGIEKSDADIEFVKSTDKAMIDTLMKLSGQTLESEKIQ